MTTDAVTAGFIPELPKSKRSGRRAGMSCERDHSSDFNALEEGPLAFDGLTRSVFHDTCLLMDHLSGRNDCSIATLELESPEAGGKVNLIDQVCSIRSTTAGPADLSNLSKHAATLFKARDKLSVFAAPATCLTIAYTLLVAPGGNGKADFARAAYPHLIEHAARFRRWIAWLTVLMMAVVVLTSAVSWYVAYGRLLLLRVEQLDAQRSEIATTRGAPTEAWQEDEDNLIQRCEEQPQPAQNIRWRRACAATEQLQHKRLAADSALQEWTSYWLWLPQSAVWALGADPAKSAVKAEIAEREEQWSADLLAILGNYVLPIMYGLLGAAAAVILNVNQKIRSCRLKPRDCRMSVVQLVLGVITGACIGLFLTPCGATASGTPLSGGNVALSASALSFLAGFGVEGVFKMIQNLLTTVFGEQPHPPATRPNG